MIFAGVDIETTGLLDKDHRIIEVYIGLWKDGKFVNALNQRIDPERSISAEAARVHGITYPDLIGQPKWQQVAPAVVKLLNAVDVIVWHNGDDFDGPFIKQELERVGLSMPRKPTFDTMQKGVWATPDGKKPSLAELCFATGIEYDPAKAHAADYDVGVMMQAFFVGVREGFFEVDQRAGMLNAA